MRQEIRNVYQFEELRDKAKEHARDWYREGNNDDNYWTECIFDDAATIADLMGIDLRQTRKGLMDGTHRYDPTIYFSGFCSQGDGACFEGDYTYKKGAPAAVKTYAPQDKELLRIAQALQDVQRKNFYRLEAKVNHRGHYYHELCTDITVWDREDPYRYIGDAVGDVKKTLRDFMRWIYKQLEKEYEFQNSDEIIDENIRINEYEFDEEGARV